MAIEKQIKSRIIHKHDTEINWNKATTFIPNQGEIIIYDIDENYAYERMKIGDGTTTIINLPFVMDNLVNVYIQKTSITDNLTTTSKDKPLSANQGYVLNQAVNNMKRSISNLQDDVDDLADTAVTEEFVNQAIAAIPTPDVSGQISTHNENEEAHMDIRTLINENMNAIDEQLEIFEDRVVATEENIITDVINIFTPADAGKFLCVADDGSIKAVAFTDVSEVGA